MQILSMLAGHTNVRARASMRAANMNLTDPPPGIVAAKTPSLICVEWTPVVSPQSATFYIPL